MSPVGLAGLKEYVEQAMNEARLEHGDVDTENVSMLPDTGAGATDPWFLAVVLLVLGSGSLVLSRRHPGNPGLKKA